MLSVIKPNKKKWTRREFLGKTVKVAVFGSAMGSLSCGGNGGRGNLPAPKSLDDMGRFRKMTLEFIEGQRVTDFPYGRYLYSAAATVPTLYSSCYAAMARSMYNDLDVLTSSQRQEWIDYLNRHQDDDGLFRDPVIYDQGWFKGDPLDCGRPHLTCHVLMALTCLNGIAEKELVWLKPYLTIDAMKQWLESRDWGERVGWTGNEILNVGHMLQYARDYQNNIKAGQSVAFLMDWMEQHHIDPRTGLWGGLDLEDPIWRSHAVQAAYHFWLLWDYDRRPIPYVERAIDNVLKTQNPNGGFGWGVHNPKDPYTSSACEDIDSIDPLCRFWRLTEYRREDIVRVLEKALPWVMRNQMSDGGFVFYLNSPYEYGHRQFFSEANTGAMFPTWFRTLSLAYIAQVLPQSWLGQYPWQIAGGPGYQFWHKNRNIG